MISTTKTRKTSTPKAGAVRYVEQLVKTKIGVYQTLTINIIHKPNGFLVEATEHDSILFTSK